MNGNRVGLLIAHAYEEADVAAQLAAPLREAGYDVVDYDSILVGESLVEKASEHLAAGLPVVICGTVQALGTGWVHEVVNAARQHPAAYLLPVRMERTARLELLSWDLKITEYWQDPARAVQELQAALAKRYPTGRPPDVATVNAEARYRSLLLEDCDLLDLTGLPERDRHLATRQLALRRLYVALRVQPEVGESDESIDPRLFDALEQERAKRRGVWVTPPPHRRAGQERVPLGERLADARRLVVLGDPGAGKSTLLRWLATAYLLRLKQDPDWAELPDVQTLPDEDWLPILVRCRDLGHDRPKSIDDLLAAPLNLLGLSRNERAATVKILLRRLHDGAALLLVDGLDEINDIQARAAFCAQLERIHVAFPKAPVVVTSRIVGYREMGTKIGRGFNHVTVADLAHDDKDEFVQRWCDLTERPVSRDKAAEALIRDIHSLDRIERLTGNPLLLTTMALVRRSLGRLPNRRAELYEETVKVLLNWRPEVGERLEPNEALPQLEYIAYAMCQRHVQQLRLDEVTDLCAEMRVAYPNLHAVHRHDPEGFIRLVEQRTGLLVEVGETRHQGQRVPVFEFRHLTFQEYLAGIALVRGHHSGHERGRRLAATVAQLATPMRPPPIDSKPPLDVGDESRLAVAESWREPIRLCAAACPSSECDELVTGILQPGTDEDATQTARPRAVLAAQCLADEPDASDRAADDVIAALVRQFWGRDDVDDSWTDQRLDVTEAVVGLASSRWRSRVLTHFVDVFLALPSVDRAALPPQIIIAIGAFFDETHKTLETQIPVLRGEDSRAAILAALTIAGVIIPRGLDPPSGAVEALISMIGASEPVADSAALALRGVHDSSDELDVPGRGGPWDRTSWQLSPTQHRMLTEVLQQQPIISDGARLSLYQLAGHAGIEAAIPLARATLTSPQRVVRAWSAWVLGSLNDLPSLPDIAALLHDAHASVRATAARAIGWCQDRGLLPAIADALEDLEPDVRAAACEALGQLRHPDSIALLTRRINDDEPIVRGSAAEALGALGDNSAAAQVAELLSDTDPGVRAVAAEVIGKLGGTEQVDALLELLNDEPEIRDAASHSLCRLADRNHLPHFLDLLTARDSYLAGAATEALVRVMGAEAVPILLENALSRGSRHTAVILLTGLVAPENKAARNSMLCAAADSGTNAVDVLANWLRATDPALLGELATVVRSTRDHWPWPMFAVASSGAAGHPDVLTAARDRLKEDDIGIRAAVATILCAAGLGDGLEALTALLTRLGWHRQQAIASALSKLESPPQEVVSVLLSLSASDHPAVRTPTAGSLARLDRPDATAAFLRLLDDPVPWVRKDTVSSLKGRRIGQNDTITNALLSRLEDRSFDVRMEVVRVLGEAPRAIAVAPLLEALENDLSGEVRREIPAALAKLNIDDTAAAALNRAVGEDPDPLVRTAAHKALHGEAQDV